MGSRLVFDCTAATQVSFSCQSCAFHHIARVGAHVPVAHTLHGARLKAPFISAVRPVSEAAAGSLQLSFSKLHRKPAALAQQAHIAAQRMCLALYTRRGMLPAHAANTV